MSGRQSRKSPIKHKAKTTSPTFLRGRGKEKGEGGGGWGRVEGIGDVLAWDISIRICIVGVRQLLKEGRLGRAGKRGLD